MAKLSLDVYFFVKRISQLSFGLPFKTARKRHLLDIKTLLSTQAAPDEASLVYVTKITIP